tara:strand:+ start:161 stop:1363 length:1203 start_codon:yes stop_codon:yes gene_type:complete
MKIGITLGIKREGEALWINGIKLNALMLAQLLKNSEKGHEVVFLNTTQAKINEKLPWDLNEFPCAYYKDVGLDCDLIFILGGQIHDNWLLEFKKSGDNKKVVSYKCGNNYVVTMESILFTQDEYKEGGYTKHIEKLFDEVWYVPQQEEVNHDYFKCLYRCPTRIAPFVYDHRWMDGAADSITKLSKSSPRYSRGARYEPVNEKKRIAVMEPNLNIVKYAMVPMMISEVSYREGLGKDYLDFISICNGLNVMRKGEWIGITKEMEIFKNNKIFFEARYSTPYFLSQHSDILLCHQLLNPLNYLYLDAAHLGYPVLHNAWMVKDLGYYYEGQNIWEGAKMLDKIYETHDKNIEEYAEQTKKVINRYSVHNPDLVREYDRMIDNLFNKQEDKLKYNYKTNLYE